MPKSSEQYGEIRKQKKRLIMETAMVLFAEYGFHATTMSKIAKKAGISKGLAYNYFKSKQEILDEIVRTGFDSIYSHFDLNRDGILTEEEFIYFIKKVFQIISENRIFWKLYISIMLQSDLAQSAQEIYSETTANILSMLNQFITSKGSKDPEGDIQAIACLLKGASLIAITDPEIFQEENMKDKITKACFRLINNNKL